MLVDLVGQRLELGLITIDMNKVKILGELKELEEKVSKLTDGGKIDISIMSDKDQKDQYELIKLPLE